MKFKANIVLASLLTTVLLVGCSGTQPLPSTDPGPSQAQASLDDVRSLLEAAQNSTSPLKEHYYLRAAKQLHLNERNDWAENLLKAIDPSLLETADFVTYTDVFSAIAMSDQAWFLAQRILTKPELEQQWANLPSETKFVLGQRRAELFALLGEPTSSIRERLRLADSLSGENAADADSNQDAIWQTLMTLPEAQLKTLSEQEKNPLLAGWYNLAGLSKNNQSDLSRQLAQVDDWARQWPEHPASLRLPSDLKLLRELIQDQAQQVALLLPMEGKLAKSGGAIRDGFMAAYYQTLNQGGYVPVVRVYNSAGGEDINSIYQRAINEGAGMVVGPLDKAQVAELNLNLQLPVPTLALNYNDGLGHNAAGLYQFGLAIEDEARQAAQRAFLEGHRHAMTLTPRSNRGQRAADAFAQEWETLGGKVVQSSHYRGSGDFSKVIQKSLNVDESRQRARDIRALFGRIEFEPRRRDDIDMIFLDANPRDARQIKPTLAFHYASKLPVYATRNIYSGRANPKADRDLNGIRFSTLPWFFDQHSLEKQAIVEYANASPAYHSLYALGLDAYHLYPRLRQLAEVPLARLYGSTGRLSLKDNNTVLREQTWAQISRGRASELTGLVNEFKH